MKKTIKIKLNKEEYETITNIMYQAVYILLKSAYATGDGEEREKIKTKYKRADEALTTIECQIDKKRLY